MMRRSPTRKGTVSRTTWLTVSTAIAAMAGCAKEVETKPRIPAKGYNLVVICIDTLRADHLGCYGYERPTSPFIDSLAKEGVVFEKALSNSSYTRESVSVLLSGLLPSNNADTGTNAKPPKAMPCMGELFQAAGYRTGFFTLSPVLKHPNFTKGFDTVRHMGTRGGSREGPELSKAAVDFVKAGEPGKPFMLYAHYLDPHFPYRPPRDTYLRFADHVYPKPISMLTVRAACPAYIRGGFGPGDERFEDMVRRYDAEIAHTDLSIKQLFAGLRESGALEKTVVLLTADHGEEFLEHGFVEHAWTLYQESIRVPLILWAPHMLKSERVQVRASTVDILPTTLGLLDIPHNERHFDGVPLFKREGGTYRPIDKSRPIIAEFLMQERCMLRAVIQDEWKYISAINWLTPQQRSVASRRLKAQTKYFREHPEKKRRIWGPAEHEELFDLRSDPGERNNVLTSHPDKRRELSEILARLKRVHETLHKQGIYVVEEPRDLDPATLERLKSLGYIGDDE